MVLLALSKYNPELHPRRLSKALDILIAPVFSLWLCMCAYKTHYQKHIKQGFYLANLIFCRTIKSDGTVTSRLQWCCAGSHPRMPCPCPLLQNQPAPHPLTCRHTFRQEDKISVFEEWRVFIMIKCKDTLEHRRKRLENINASWMYLTLWGLIKHRLVVRKE